MEDDNILRPRDPRVRRMSGPPKLVPRHEPTFYAQVKIAGQSEETVRLGPAMMPVKVYGVSLQFDSGAIDLVTCYSGVIGTEYFYLVQDLRFWSDLTLDEPFLVLPGVVVELKFRNNSVENAAFRFYLRAIGETWV